jgi:hypothetical protein
MRKQEVNGQLLINKTNNMAKELPQYQCHKKVWALKIKKVVSDAELANEENRETDGSGVLHFEEEGYDPIRVDFKFMRKHTPQVGWYFVVYNDNYNSVSPAEPFEEGYTLINQ